MKNGNRDALQQAWDAAPEIAQRLHDGERHALKMISDMRKDAERYRWLRDVGSKTLTPFTSRWNMSSEKCDECIDIEIDRQRGLK